MIGPMDPVRLRDGVITKVVGHEMVLLDYEHGIYYGLNDVGARTLSLMAEGCSLVEVVDRLLEEFEVSRSALQADLERLLGELQSKGLLDSV